jgi:GNAT superfamily N-acetyltransferase
MSLKLTASIARPSDYEAIARLCKRATGPDDYALRILQDVIKDKGLFLAWHKEHLVGITHLEPCIDGSAWLSMARTDPSWRGRGVALFLQNHLADYARRKEIKTLRLWVLSENVPSLNVCKKGGFRPVCEAAHVTYELGSRERKIERFSPVRSRSKIPLKDLLSSRYLSKMHGYLAYKWHFIKADRKLLERVRRKGELLSIEDSAFIITRPEMRFRTLQSSFSLLRGPMPTALEYVKSIARSLGVSAVRGYVPYDHHQLMVARKFGFHADSWGNHCIVFEEPLEMTEFS